MSKAVNRIIMKEAGRDRTRARGVIPTIALDVVASGAAENVRIGGMEVTYNGIPQDLNEFLIQPVFMSNGQLKWGGASGFDLLTGPVPTDINTSAVAQGFGSLMHKKTFETVWWSVDVSVVSGIESYSALIPSLGKLKLNDGDIAALIAQCPIGNTVTIQRTALSAIELTAGPIYTLGSNMMPAPSLAYRITGVEGAGYNSWVEDGQERTMSPYFSEAQGNGPGALGNQVVTTAKPMMRMSVVWRQAFSGKLLLCFDGESMDTAGNTVGLSKVRAYVEGAYFDSTVYQSVQIIDHNGDLQWLYGFFVEVDADLYTAYGTDRTRGIHVIARGYSADGTQQTQLIGGLPTDNLKDQFHFYPMPVGHEHDYLVRIDPDQVAQITVPAAAYPGVYATTKTYEDAEKYLTGTTVGGFNIGANKALRPRVEYMKEGGLLNPTNIGSVYAGRGYLTLCAGPGVTTFDIGRTFWDYTRVVTGIYNMYWKPLWMGIEFRGKEINNNFDFFNGMAYTSSQPSSTAMRHWANGCKGKWSFDPSQELNSKGTVSSPGGYAFQTFTDGMDCVNVQGIAVGINNRRNTMAADYATSTGHLVGEQCDFWGCDIFRNTVDLVRFKYLGADPAAYWKKTEDAGVAGGIFSLISTDGTLTLALASNTDRGLVAQEIVDWGNTVNPALWQAERLFTPGDRYSERAPKYIQPQASVACPINTWSAPARTRIEIHQDFNAGAKGKTHNNYCLRRIRLYEVDTTQFDFMDGNFISVCKDSVWLDNNPNGVKSQYTSSSYTRNHYMALGNMDLRSNYAFRNTDVSAAAWDAKSDLYTWIKGCIFNKFAWDVPSTASPNRPKTMANVAPGGDDGVGRVQLRLKQVAMTMDTIYPFRKTKKDLRPSGPLMDPANFDVPPSKVDAQGIWRKASGPMGPTVRGLDDGTITGAEFRNLAAVSCTNDVGSNVAGLSVSFKTGVGNTGATKTAVIQFDVA